MTKAVEVIFVAALHLAAASLRNVTCEEQSSCFHLGKIAEGLAERDYAFVNTPIRSKTWTRIVKFS